jgi:hypothetical protein
MIKKIAWFTGGFSFLFLLFFLWKIAKADTTAIIPQLSNGQGKKRFDVSGCIRRADKSALFASFPYKDYLDSESVWDIDAVKHDLLVMDSLNADQGENRKTLSNALTQVLASRERVSLQTWQPDSLLRLIQWSEQFRYYAQYDGNSDLFYQSVYQYWFDLVTGRLSALSRDKPSLKYDFKFKYLVTRCYEQRFATSLKITSYEKAFDNVLYSNWGHLINAGWTQSSTMIKVLLFLFLLLTGYGVFAIVEKIIFALKNSKK